MVMNEVLLYILGRLLAGFLCCILLDLACERYTAQKRQSKLIPSKLYEDKFTHNLALNEGCQQCVNHGFCTIS